jgi:uncharacterized membrane protein YkvA (DUF1232 family)
VSAREAEQQFVDTMSSWLISLPFDLKILYEATDDENLSREAREMAVGGIIYAISPNDAIADRHDSFVSYCDDCIVIRLALQPTLRDQSAEARQFRERFSQFFDTLAADLGVCKHVMGNELFSWIAEKAQALRQLTYKGKTVNMFLDDGDAASLLYEDGLAFTTDYPIEEEALADKFKKASTVTDFMQRRKAEEARTRAAGSRPA